MKDLALYLLTNLVTKPEEIQISETQNDENYLTLTITVAKEDMGRVIGKNGKIIRSIREVIKILALKLNQRVDIILTE